MYLEKKYLTDNTDLLRKKWTYGL